MAYKVLKHVNKDEKFLKINVIDHYKALWYNAEADYSSIEDNDSNTNEGDLILRKNFIKLLRLETGRQQERIDNHLRKGRSCIDNIFIIAQIIEKHHEFNRDACGINRFQRSFRSSRNTLWQVLDEQEYPQQLNYSGPISSNKNNYYEQL